MGHVEALWVAEVALAVVGVAPAKHRLLLACGPRDRVRRHLPHLGQPPRRHLAVSGAEGVRLAVDRWLQVAAGSDGSHRVAVGNGVDGVVVPAHQPLHPQQTVHLWQQLSKQSRPGGVGVAVLGPFHLGGVGVAHVVAHFGEKGDVERGPVALANEVGRHVVRHDQAGSLLQNPKQPLRTSKVRSRHKPRAIHYHPLVGIRSGVLPREDGRPFRSVCGEAVGRDSADEAGDGLRFEGGVAVGVDGTDGRLLHKKVPPTLDGVKVVDGGEEAGRGGEGGGVRRPLAVGRQNGKADVFEDARPGVGEGVPRRMAHKEVVEGAGLFPGEQLHSRGAVRGAVDPLTPLSLVLAILVPIFAPFLGVLFLVGEANAVQAGQSTGGLELEGGHDVEEVAVEVDEQEVGGGEGRQVGAEAGVPLHHPIQLRQHSADGAPIVRLAALKPHALVLRLVAHPRPLPRPLHHLLDPLDELRVGRLSRPKHAVHKVSPELVHSRAAEVGLQEAEAVHAAQRARGVRRPRRRYVEQRPTGRVQGRLVVIAVGRGHRQPVPLHVTRGHPRDGPTTGVGITRRVGASSRRADGERRGVTEALVELEGWLAGLVAALRVAVVTQHRASGVDSMKTNNGDGHEEHQQVGRHHRRPHVKR
mmetsp:Transcript_2298/g.4027  ORF Transcript_2298/g.4027 Transcript_2298/m.4027 type:complete len:641 (+) Transcript_2298:254-2176(+)